MYDGGGGSNNIGGLKGANSAPESEMDALLLGKTRVRREITINHFYLKQYALQRTENSTAYFSLYGYIIIILIISIKKIYRQTDSNYTHYYIEYIYTLIQTYMIIGKKK